MDIYMHDVTPENLALSVAVQFGLDKADVMDAYASFAAFTSHLTEAEKMPDFATAAPPILSVVLRELNPTTAFLFGLWLAAGIWSIER